MKKSRGRRFQRAGFSRSKVRIPRGFLIFPLHIKYKQSNLTFIIISSANDLYRDQLLRTNKDA